ncbi:hypothetical protein [Bacillus pinisoli]|uniref:hypothetical protein n=1 Tax=Bacillus pinisoli TaxID=2901866 RepID=UPI001FF63228|nr:hypothetical protein [Bacillus pinisoli]
MVVLKMVHSNGLDQHDMRKSMDDPMLFLDNYLLARNAYLIISALSMTGILKG